MPTIVQFLHPFIEATTKYETDNVISWNNHEDHRRKFIVSSGKYVSTDNSEKVGELTFWGEWEAQSRIKKIIKSNNNPPNFLNFPYINISEFERLHTTDPFVFGERFRYFICLQKQFSNILKNLDPFSIILFGSNISKKFCLDTLFVVSENQRKYKFNDLGFLLQNNTKNKFYLTSIEPIIQNLNKHCGRGVATQTYTYYESVNYNDKNKYDGIFSFAPSKLYDPNKVSSSTFKMPTIDLDIIGHTQTRGIKTTQLDKREISMYWTEITEQLKKQNLLLGTQFDLPKLET